MMAQRGAIHLDPAMARVLQTKVDRAAAEGGRPLVCPVSGQASALYREICVPLFQLFDEERTGFLTFAQCNCLNETTGDGSITEDDFAEVLQDAAEALEAEGMPSDLERSGRGLSIEGYIRVAAQCAMEDGEAERRSLATIGLDVPEVLLPAGGDGGCGGSDCHEHAVGTRAEFEEMLFQRMLEAANGDEELARQWVEEFQDYPPFPAEEGSSSHRHGDDDEEDDADAEAFLGEAPDAAGEAEDRLVDEELASVFRHGASIGDAPGAVEDVSGGIAAGRGDRMEEEERVIAQDVAGDFQPPSKRPRPSDD